MIPRPQVPARAAAALAEQAEAVTQATLVTVDGRTVDLPVLDGRVVGDQRAMVRWTLDCVVDPALDPSLLSPLGAKVAVRRGVHLPDGGTFTWPLGVFWIDDRDLDSPSQGWRIVGSSAESVVAADDFTSPRPGSGPSALRLIRDLISESLPGALFSVRTTRDVPVPSVVWDASRWDAVYGREDSLATAAGVVVHTDPNGGWVIDDIPTLGDDPAWTFTADPGGLQVSTRSSDSIDGAYNVVVVRGERTDGTPAVQGVAEQRNKFAPLWVGGPRGRRVKTLTTPILTTAQACAKAAATHLPKYVGVRTSVSFASSPAPFVLPGMVVKVDVPTTAGKTTSKLQLLDRVTYPLGAGEQTAEARSNREA